MNIVVINGHPVEGSLNDALMNAYVKGAKEAGATVSTIVVRELFFNPILETGYTKRMDLEPDLLEAWDKIKDADHLVWVHPVWWGGLPALLKGFIDRLFLPGMAFKSFDDSWKWEKLLKGKTARIITTLDQPGWFYHLYFGRPSINLLRKSVLNFCGVKPVKVTYVGTVKGSSDKQREKWIAKAYALGKQKK